MITNEIELKMPGGVMDTFIIHPDENGPFPIILFLMDAPGKREELHDMASRIAASGYYVMLPNLYYRKTRDFIFEPTSAGRVKMLEQMDNLTNDLAVQDCLELIKYGDSDPNTNNGDVGCVGYCMSGPFAFCAASAIPKRIKASASIHGVKLLTGKDDSPHLNASLIKAEMYFAMAEKDKWADPKMVDELDEHLKEIGINYRIEWYAGTDHGFVFPNRGPLYDKASAEKHYQRLLSLFERNLKRITR